MDALFMLLFQLHILWSKSIYIYIYMCHIFTCLLCIYKTLNHPGQKSQSETISRPASEFRGKRHKSSSLFFNINVLLHQMGIPGKLKTNYHRCLPCQNKKIEIVCCSSVWISFEVKVAKSLVSLQCQLCLGF